MKRIATALAALLLAAGISWGQDPDLTGFLEQLENVNGRMATAMNNDDKEEMENLYTEIVVMYEQQPGSVKKTAAPIMGGVWYNLACLRSLRGDTDGAVDAFKQALGYGWNDYAYTMNDPDLKTAAKTHGSWPSPKASGKALLRRGRTPAGRADERRTK